MTKNKGGRNPIITESILQILDEAFRYAYTDEEAALYAGISVRALYYYQKKNPEFLQRKEALRLTPNLAAKRTLVENIVGDLNQARWWAEHKMRNEFGTKIKVEQNDNSTHNGDITSNDEFKALGREYNQKLRALYARPLKQSQS